ncbi:MAG: ATP-binding cassette domain-containing protein [Prevotellaceae bacterium]|nr:ATP-binding cassette domain-containing protein [Prevotellaceae bacterium]
MKTIALNTVKPDIFSESDVSGSEIWLKNICFEKQNTYLIFSESGKGKSSLFDFIYCRRNDYSGEIMFDGKNVKAFNSNQKRELRSNHISLVFQGFRLFEELTAMENIEIKNRLTNHKTKRQIEEMFEQMGISSKINSPLSLLSFGQKQRVAIIRSLCQPFDFLLLDETFSHLDETNYTIACSLIAAEVKNQNAALMVASLGETYKFNYNYKIRL